MGLGKLFGFKKGKQEDKEEKQKGAMKLEQAVKKPQSEATKPRYEEKPDPFAGIDGEEAVSSVLSGRFQVVDVRSHYEYQSHHIPGSIHIFIQQLENRYKELDPTRDTLVVCERGIRSQDACWFLSDMGFKQLFHLTGGLSVYKGPQEGTRVGNPD